MRFMPININIEGKRIVMIGGGKVALHKATILRRYTDRAVVVARQFAEGFHSLDGFTLKAKDYETADIEGAWIVYICTDDHGLNARIKADCEQRGILASTCDNPSLCDFTSPAVYRHDFMTVAVASDANDVRRSIEARNAIAQLHQQGLLQL